MNPTKCRGFSRASDADDQRARDKGRRSGSGHVAWPVKVNGPWLHELERDEPPDTREIVLVLGDQDAAGLATREREQDVVRKRL